jgi:basic amino acid/polyamine antiporter, APA family
MEVLRTKTVEQTLADAEERGHSLRRALGPIQLTMLGIGVVIGTGIFVLTGEAAGTIAGPAIAISFAVAAVACALAGLCYAEFASVVPIAGSAYTFSYASLGELVAWIIGWDLMLELAFGAATVASGWSQYLTSSSPRRRGTCTRRPGSSPITITWPPPSSCSRYPACCAWECARRARSTR